MRRSANEPTGIPVNRDPRRRFLQGLIGFYLVVACAAPYLFGPILALILVACLAAAIVFRFTLPTAAFGWTIALASLGVFGVLHGSIAGHEGAFSMASVFVMEPLLLGLLLPMVYHDGADITHLFRALDVALLATAGLGFLLYVNTVGNLQLPIDFLIDPRFTAVDLSADTLRTNFQGYNSLVFLAPYALYRCMGSGGPDSLSSPRRIILGVAALSGIILSGRQVLYLSTPLAFLFTWAFTRQPRTTHERANEFFGRVFTFAFILGLMGLCLPVLGLSVPSTISRTISQITFLDPSDVRAEESRVLLQKWFDSPFLGHGTGTTIAGYLRDQQNPWSFELSYHVLLVTFGAAGIALFAAWSVWILKRLKTTDAGAQVRNRCIMAGFVGALLGAITNPYFFKIDGIWMAFVPFAVAVAAASQKPYPQRGTP